MDREKLNKAAEEFFKRMSIPKFRKGSEFLLQTPTYYELTNEECFKQGADWLMQQPLSERLTDEEKEKIKDDYNSLAHKLQEKFNLSMSEKVIANAAIGSVLTHIFGADLF